MPEDRKNEEIRVGVYICYCGGNISDVVDCEQVREAVAVLPGVVVSRTNMSMCSDAGQAQIEEDIQKVGVNRVVIGACAPSLHELTFRSAVTRAGLNPYLYCHVNLREQDSWVHHNNPQAATVKAVVLMKAGIAKARHLQPLEPFRMSAEKHTLVIGGGVAGLRAAWDIARQGIHVSLIEKTPFLGGRMARLGTTFPDGSLAQNDLHALIENVSRHPHISIYTHAELKDLSGYVGDFQATISVCSRGVREGLVDFEAAANACPVEVPDEFNEGLTTRKAIYRLYPGCFPALPAIDWENCTQCGACKVANGHIDLEKKTETITLHAGAIVVATGFKPYEPRRGEYGYGEIPEVLTLPQMIRLLEINKNAQDLVFNGRRINSIGLIHCVGSRHIPGINKPLEDGKINDYCSRVCCTATLHIANEIKQKYPQTHIFDLYEDIRTYGRGHEDYYQEASKNKVRFLCFKPEELPEVVASESAEHPLSIRAKDVLTQGLEIDVPVDLIVLAVGIMPNPIEEITRLLKINAGADRFLAEVHPKLRPVETAVPGIVLAGTAQGPMNIQESCAAASAAASKVAMLLGKGSVELEPFIAVVDEHLCDGSGKCVEVCAYEDAISLVSIQQNGREIKRAVVTPANCAGCGSCVSACPNKAIDLQGWTLAQYEAVLDAIAEGWPEMEVAS
jgi:heterodisulfide reductase subunit A